MSQYHAPHRSRNFYDPFYISKQVILLVLFIFLYLPSQSSAQTMENQKLSEVSNSNLVIKSAGSIETSLKQNSEKILLEKTISILEKTNSALTQKWTPINTMLAVTASLFMLITILWAGIFAFGFLAYKKIEKSKRDILKDRRSFKSQTNEILKNLDRDSKKILGESSVQKSKSPEIMEEINKLKDRTEKAVERLEDRTYKTISSVSSDIGIPISQVGGIATGLWNTKPASVLVGEHELYSACEGCGVLFVNENSSSISFSSSIVFGQKNLCKKCKEGEEKK